MSASDQGYSLLGTTSSKLSELGLILRNTVMGTPQARWRDTTQSGFVSIMPRMRFSPCGGTQRVSLMAARARWRNVSVGASTSIALSMAMNHCGVLRKITGFFERQEWG